jgi:putative phosphoribosyl transferase
MKPQIESRSISIPIGRNSIDGDLNIPAASSAAVLFAYGSGSSRHSPRKKYVAEVLNRAGLATLLLELLTPDEEVVEQRTAPRRFDVDLLAERLVLATDWLTLNSNSHARHIGYFGASTGAAAALVAAAKRPKVIEAVVSPGGRPGLTERSLSVRAPSLLIVGEYDHVVMELNRRAAAGAVHRIEIVAGATHLEERGALDEVVVLAQRWLTNHLGRDQNRRGLVH